MSAPQRARPAPPGADPIHEEEALGKAYDGRLLLRLWPFIAPYRAQVLLTLLMVVPIFFLELAPAWIVKTGLDRAVGGSAGPRWLAPPTGIDPFLWLAGLYLVVMLANSALSFAHALVMSTTGIAAMRDLRRAVFGHVQKLHQGFFDRYPVGRLVTRATNDVENVNEMFSAGIVALVTDLAKMIGIAIFLFLVDHRLAVITFSVVPFLAVAAIVFRMKVRDAFRAVRVRIARINAYLQEHVTGMKVVQLFTHEEKSFRDFDAMNADHRDAWFMSIRYDSALFAVVELASGITVALVIWQATGLADAGKLYVFIDWMRRFFLPLRDLSAKYSVMQSSMASAERIFQLFDTEPAVTDRDLSKVVPLRAAAGERGSVEFDHVSFAYQDQDWVLEDVSFRVAPGEKVAFVGATGAGKTTIIKLLTRLYEPTHGRILLDGVDLRDLRQSDLRRRVAMVLQDVFLFSGTIAQNIGLERSDVDRASIERVSRAVRADRFVQALPDRYDTQVRERATNFSAGERQLLSFARALAHGGDVLVLDEATSSIDSETEALIEEGTHTLLAGRTALVIAHRLSTIQDVDRIYVLHKGRIVESGSHDQLLAAGGVYHRLYRLQYESQERRAAAG
jgi:ATP-binding cassette subfamily B protein